jgi:hypothetical protein
MVEPQVYNYAILVSVKKDHILKGSLQSHKVEIYSNFIEWSNTIRLLSAHMIPFNGNHKVTHITNKFQQQFHNYFMGLEIIKGAYRPVDHKMAAGAQVKKAKTVWVLIREAMWLISLVDLGKYIFW